ncbi:MULTISPECIES: helix-turn-helix transcriptional regulator [unclassified Streptomyces]|uniref:helix-turn-helix domain-containing protein n=1 Tax=unclassified Streptomyces TaxID=2593676 RepID=UPI00081F7048|nr:MULTISPECIES: helix-turn-helix transcriptional regulator [unclassified Streptomyces]MYZ40420.1 helix-turn-helix domain-containing protein [Streptomyces sp. SID4917]SCG07547.1 Helix-turn-helix domain-containing protein [Streptomyces sp. MnatMP-M17]
MAPRKALTARQRRLGSELRKIREHTGLSIAQAAALLGADRTTISNTESGRFGVSPARVRAWASHYKCPDVAYIDALADMAGERINGWWEDYRGDLSSAALDLAELEHHAVGIRSVEIMHFPGLLQTEDYARAVFAEAVPAPNAAHLRRLLSHRLKRRDVLDRPEPPACTFLVHEAALRMTYGGPKVTRGQLDYLLEESERDNVTVRAVPFAAGGFPHANSSAHYVYGPVPQLDTVQTDTATGSGFLDAETSLVNWRVALDRTEEKSLDPESSRDFIRKIAQQV